MAQKLVLGIAHLVALLIFGRDTANYLSDDMDSL